MKTKRFIAMALVFSVMLFALACTKGTTGSGDKNFIAKDATGFMVINMNAVANAGIIDEFSSDDEDFQKKLKEFQTKTGLDPKKDLKSGIGVFLSKMSGSAQPEMYALLIGNFDQAKIIAAIKVSGEAEIDEIDIDGYKVFKSKDLNDAKTSYVHFIDNEKIVFAEKTDTLLIGIKTITGKADNLSANAELSALYDKADKDHMFWGVFTVPPSGEGSEGMGGGMMPPGFDDIKNVYFGGSYENKALDINFNLYASSADSSKQIATGLEGFKAMFKGMVADEPAAAELLDSIAINQEGEAVVISFSMTKEQMDALKGMGGGMGR